MDKKTSISLVEGKINELTSVIATLKTNDAISKATRGTQLYARGRERRVLHLIKSLIEQAGENAKLNKDDQETFALITTLAEERVRYDAVEVNEGDDLMELLKKYESRKDILKKLQTAAEKKGLKVDFASQSIVKA